MTGVTEIIFIVSLHCLHRPNGNSAAHAVRYFSTLFSSCLDATLHSALAVALGCCKHLKAFVNVSQNVLS